MQVLDNGYMSSYVCNCPTQAGLFIEILPKPIEISGREYLEVKAGFNKGGIPCGVLVNEVVEHIDYVHDVGKYLNSVECGGFAYIVQRGEIITNLLLRNDAREWRNLKSCFNKPLYYNKEGFLTLTQYGDRPSIGVCRSAMDKNGYIVADIDVKR